MQELETQVVKIQLGDLRQATSYVYTLAEKIDITDSELYMICELPLFNPAAAAECQRIAEAVAASLKRSYRKNVTNSTFENALAIINDELGKLVSLGKTHWIGKLNAVLAVKRGTTLSVASVGKISAQLFREGNFASITEAGAISHPLKTFENFSEGKLRLGDLLVISTTQLFNHISVDRIRGILQKNELTDAAQQIISILQDTMGPEGACGTILALQTEPTAATDEEVDLQTYMAGPSINSSVKDENWLDRIKTMGATAGTIGKNLSSDMRQKIKNRPSLSDIVSNRSGSIGMVQNQFKRVTKQFQPATIRSLSRTKKLFLISAAILLVALIANIVIARYYQTQKNKNATTVASISSLEKLANDANAALLYGDESQAITLLSDLQKQLEALTNVPTDQVEAVDKVRAQAQELQNKVGKVTPASPTNLGTLGNADHLISLPNYLATETNRTVVGYNRTSKSIQDNVLRTSEPILRSTFLKNNTAVIYNGSELLVWNFQNGVIGGAFSDQVPKLADMGGMRLYPTNNRVYIIDRANRQVISFAATETAFSKPTVSISAVPELASASDLAIDGSIYIATGGTILKFNSGARQEFTPGVTSLSDTTKLYTQPDFTNLYVLDKGNKRVVILSKSGSLVKTITSDQFNDLKDFSVDEKGKTIYILNNTSLLSIGI